MNSTAPAATTSAEPPAGESHDRAWLPRLLVAWTIVLVAGFGVVLGLGGPLADPVDELAAAYEPATPVTESIARASAATIVRLQFPELAGFEPSVERRDDFGIARWVVVYADPGGATGLRVSITEREGTVEVSSYP